jgi:hypothetical protein
VLTSVRGCTHIFEAGRPRQLCELSMIAQVSNGLPGLLRNQAVPLILGLVIILVIGGVLLPAVWSRKRARRTAALAVLDRILRWRH